MPLPELRDWTVVRLSLALENRVLTCVAATGYAYNRAGAPDGTLILTSDLCRVDETEGSLTTRNTTYRLNGPVVPFDSWDESRYEAVWTLGNYDSGLLSRLEGVASSSREFSSTIWDPRIVELHLTQRRLLTAVNLGTDIDNGWGEAVEIPDVSLSRALDAVAKKTASLKKMLSPAYQMRIATLNKLCGIEPAISHPGFPPALTITVDDVAQVPVRLIAVAEVVRTIAAHLPERLGPWALCAWFVANNPNLHDCETPIAGIENGLYEEVVRAAKLFPWRNSFS